LNNIGICYQHLGNYEAALKNLTEGLVVKEKMYGPTHPSLASSHVNIGLLYQSRQDHDKALQHFKKSADIFKTCYGDKHPQLQSIYRNVSLSIDRNKELSHKFKELSVESLKYI
jgi:tetratricopeptide (TPR) repeat protein